MTAYSVRQKTRPGRPPKKKAENPKTKRTHEESIKRRHNPRSIPPFGRPAK